MYGRIKRAYLYYIQILLIKMTKYIHACIKTTLERIYKFILYTQVYDGYN